jgi:hypothetical protein
MKVADPIFANEVSAAQLLDMKLDEFRSLVEEGHVPIASRPRLLLAREEHSAKGLWFQKSFGGQELMACARVLAEDAH